MSTKRGWRTLWILSLVGLVAALSFGPALAAPLRDPDPPDEDGETTSIYCLDAELEHPVGKRLATMFEVDYAVVLGWFCDDGMGFGQIMLALTTAKATGEDAADLLAERTAGKGWGEIWQEQGLIGRGPHQNRMAEDDEMGRPEGAGRPEEKGPPPGLDRDGPPGLRIAPPALGRPRGRARP